MAKGDNYRFRTIILTLLTMYCTVVSEGCVLWKLASKPAVFGTNVKLHCKFCNDVPCCDAFTRKWTKGTRYDLIVMNSVSLNSVKYEEFLNVSTKTSILTIKNFTGEDVNIPYECAYGFDTYSKVLTLNSTDFEYHPTEDVPVKLHINRNQTATASIIFNKVYPVPECFANDDGSDITSNLSVATERNGLFYRSNLQFQYQLTDNCYQNISIHCIVGKKSLTVVNSALPCSSKLSQKKIIATIVSTSWILVSIGVLIVLLCKRRNYICVKHVKFDSPVRTHFLRQTILKLEHTREIAGIYSFEQL